MNSRYSWSVKAACGGALVLALLVCYPDSWGSKADARAKSDPLVGYSFQVDVEGKLTGYFKACSGIGSTNELVEHKLVDKSGGERISKIPGRMRWGDAVLTRGLTADMKLWAWRQEVVNGKITEARAKCTVTMMGPDAKPVAVWELTNAWPSGLTMSAKTAGDTPVEEVTLTYESMQRRQ